MLFNKEKRIKYLGFNDLWFIVIGIILLSFVTDYLFASNSFARLPFLQAVINWGISVIFSTSNWIVMRLILIGLRKRYPNLKDDAKRIAFLFLAIVSTVLIIDFAGSKILQFLIGESYNHPSRSKLVLPVILISIMTMAIYEAIYYYVRLKKSIREEEQAKQAIVQAQLDALRNQAQPHFFFNSLNTLRDIIDQNPKEDAKEFVDRLADIYRFILDSGNVNLIALREELKFARAYIHVQKERFGENLKLDWNVPAGVMDQLIVPMSLQLLLENAIKHNVISKARPLAIHVHEEDGHLVVTNQIQLKSTKLPSTKLGLRNIRKRYALIADNPVRIQKEDNKFVVALPLLKAKDQKKSYAGTDY
ncbi:sensor histidine kinase [Poritiphilus flavus]|uniref:Histidine kinase n=1 Tax=Poritiphilus flavus TaxID=2697053 RepID=A0A6L9EF44_9FLAO|nr:histidine kinase [Poritiphilus flavus]NAS13291.1 histidine kinase [Poritiphilus flavus]